MNKLDGVIFLEKLNEDLIAAWEGFRLVGKKGKGG